MANEKGEDPNQKKYEKIPMLPKDISVNDIRHKGSKLVKMLVDHALYANPIKKKFYDQIDKLEKDRRLYGDVEDFGDF